MVIARYETCYLHTVPDPGQLQRASDDYRATADRLDELAAVIARDAGYLSEWWRAASASGAQVQLRQHYASLRSVAVSARATADALDHAAAVLAGAKSRAGFIDGGEFFDTDPRSFSARRWQALLAEVNDGYRQAIQMAPTQIAYNLPTDRESRYDGPIKGWSSSQTPDPSGRVGAAGVSGGPGEGWRPARVPPTIPANPTWPGKGAPGRTAAGEPARSSGAGPAGEASSRSAHDAGSWLAGGGAGGIGGRLPGGGLSGGAGIRPGPGGYGAVPGGGDAGSGSGAAGGVPGGTGPGAGAEAQRLAVPPGQGGHRDEGRERERRYFLPEEREFWDAGGGVPAALLYGDQRPPEPANREEDGGEW